MSVLISWVHYLIPAEHRYLSGSLSIFCKTPSSCIVGIWNQRPRDLSLALFTSLSGYVLSIWSLATLGRNLGSGWNFAREGRWENKGQHRKKLVEVTKESKVDKTASARWVRGGWEQVERTRWQETGRPRDKQRMETVIQRKGWRHMVNGQVQIKWLQRWDSSRWQGLEQLWVTNTEWRKYH